MKHWLIGAPVKDLIPSIGLLLFRIAFGGFMLIGHGWGKLMSFGETAAQFPDPLGIGNELSMGAAVFAEVICSALVMLGLATRFAVLPLVFTMAIAAIVVHGGDPFATKELALMYLSAYALLFFTGPGCFSVDTMVFHKK